MNSSLAKLCRKAAALMSSNKREQKKLYKYFKNEYSKTPEARSDFKEFIEDVKSGKITRKTQMEGEGDA